MARNTAIHVEGLNGLVEAFAAADKHVKEDLRDALQEAAAPVRSAAQSLAGTQISHMGGTHRPWARMRIGIAGRSVVYVAPVERGAKSRGARGVRGRPNLARLLLDRAMEPALAQNTSKVEERLDHLLDEVVTVWERVPGDARRGAL